ALKLDARCAVRLFPRASGDPRTVHGAGYATLFLYYVATMGLLVYGPAVLQTLRGLSALAAGYVVSAEALFWTAVALPVAGLAGFAHGFSPPAARTAGVWVFLAALPVAALACLSAWYMGRPRSVRTMDPS